MSGGAEADSAGRVGGRVGGWGGGEGGGYASVVETGVSGHRLNPVNADHEPCLELSHEPWRSLYRASKVSSDISLDRKQELHALL